MSLKQKELQLISEARSAWERAYAPYSRFPVGAALQTKGGSVHVGCNVENVSFSLTLCAERNAVGHAVATGDRDFELLALIADSADPVVPCGGCRQILAEFNPTLRIISSNLEGTTAEFRLDQLLPLARQGILEKFHMEHGTG